jgi:hypothetical protein
MMIPSGFHFNVRPISHAGWKLYNEDLCHFR